MAKRWLWAVGGLAAIGGIGAGVAFAESEMRDRRGGWDDDRGGWHHHRGGMGGMFRRVRTKEDAMGRARARFARIDANSDGVADRSEISAVVERRMERRGGRRGQRMARRAEHMMRRFDADRDGRVTTEEVRTRVAERFTRNDIDADGAITDADLPPMLRGRNLLKSDAGWLPRRRWARRLARLRRANANNDDRVTLEEVQAMAVARFARFDANSDGTIDMSDRDARRAERLDYRVSRMLARFGAAGQDSISRDAFIAEIEKRFDRRDIDGDGVLSRSERRGWGRGGRWREGRGGRYDEPRGERREGRRGPPDGDGRLGPQRDLDWTPDEGPESPLAPEFERDARWGAPVFRVAN